MSEAAALRTEDIGTVEDRFFTLRDFRLADGTVMPEATIAYETYGRLRRRIGRNAVLITHGYTGSHHAAGRNPANGNQPGSWDGLIGPGKAIDTDRLFVVATNMLGSSYGSTNAASINPATGQPYGPDFPAIAIRDIVAAQKALLDSLGVKHLVAVAGPSYGGYQAFQWAVAYPDFMDAIVPVEHRALGLGQHRQAAGRDAGAAGDRTRMERRPLLRQRRVQGGTDRDPHRDAEALRHRGEPGAARFVEPAAREAAIRELAANWARNWDANSLVILRRALLGFDTRPDFAKIKAKVLYVLCRTDALFPPKIAPGVIDALQRRRGRGALFRDRQRPRPLVERPRTREMVAGAARVPGPASRPRRLNAPRQLFAKTSFATRAAVIAAGQPA